PPLDRDFALLDGLPGKRQNEDLRRASMREFMRTATRHWVSPLLFTLYWLVAMGLAVQQLLTGPGKISEINLALLILVPVLAGALVVFLGGWITAAAACGATFGILDFALLLNLYLLRFPP